MTTTPSPPPLHDHRMRWRATAVGIAALVFAGAGAGVAMAATTGGSPSIGMSMADGASSMDGGTSAMAACPVPTPDAKATQLKPGVHIDPARQAWAHEYGMDRDTMPTLAPVAQASAAQQAAALALLQQTEADTAKYADIATAKAAGFNLPAALRRDEEEHPALKKAIARVDAGHANPCHLPMLHVGNKANRDDGKVLDPNAPETLMYSYVAKGDWKLIGVMYTANEAYPAAPPDPGGPITRWHYHDDMGGQRLMMHVFFVPGNDLAHAYATVMT